MKIRGAWFFLSVGLISPAAVAYVYPSSFVLGNWVEKVKGVRTLHVRQKTTIHDSKFPDGSITLDEEIWVRRPSEYRRSATYPNGKLDLIVGKDRAVQVWAGKAEVVPLADTLGLLGGLYLYADKGRLNAFLRQIGVDLNQTRWVLRDRQIGLEIGDPKTQRVVFAKEDSVPLGAEIGERSFRFDMGVPTRFPIRYPSVLEVMSGGRLLEKIEVINVETNIPLSDSYFEIPRLRPSPGKK